MGGYTIGHAVWALSQDDRKDLARQIIGCKAKGNALAADVMRKQLAEIDERERQMWRQRKEEDERIVREQLERWRRCRPSDYDGDDDMEDDGDGEKEKMFEEERYEYDVAEDDTEDELDDWSGDDDRVPLGGLSSTVHSATPR